MNWDAIAAIGQAVGAAALVIVIVQVSQAHAELRRNVSQARADARRDLWMAQAENSQLSTLLNQADVGLGREALNPFVALLVERAEMTPQEGFQAMAYRFGWWIYHAQVIRYIDQLDRAERVQVDSGVRTFYSTKGGRAWYEAFKDSLDPHAVRYVDSVLARHG